MSCRSAMAGVSALLGSVAPVSGEVSWVHNQRKISRRSYVCPSEVATWSGSGSELGSGPRWPPGVPRYAVRTARTRLYACPVRTVRPPPHTHTRTHAHTATRPRGRPRAHTPAAPPRPGAGKRPCASGTYSTQAAGTRSRYSYVRPGGPGRTAGAHESAYAVTGSSMIS